METATDLDNQARATAKTYQGGVAWLTVGFALIVVALYVSVLASACLGAIPLPVAALLTVPIVYMSYTVMHEAAHGSISGNDQSFRWLNDWLGYLAGWILMVPLTAHRHEHLTHHRNTNDPEADPDYVVASISRSLWFLAPVQVNVVISQYRHYLGERWSKASRGQNIRFCLELIAAVGGRALLMSAGYFAEGVAVFLVGGFAGLMLTTYLFAYLVHQPHEAVGPYVDTSTIIAPRWCNGVVTWVWLFQNYHSIHHLFPRVPFYRYRALFNEIEPVMRARGAPVYDLRPGGLQRREAATTAMPGQA